MSDYLRTNREYFGISPVWERKRPARPRSTFRQFSLTVGGKNHEFKTEDEAFQFRSEQLLERERNRELTYDRNAPYISVSVHPPLIPHTTRTMFGKDVAEPRKALYVDVAAYELGIQHTCERIARDGFEVIAITPLQSAVAHSFSKPVGEGGAGGGWGLSYTEGVIITARKARETT